MSRRPWVRWSATFVVAAGVLTACGSTVAGTTGAAQDLDAGGLALAQGPAESGSTPNPDGQTSASRGEGSSQPLAAEPSASSALAAVPTGRVPSPAPALGPARGKPVEVGVILPSTDAGKAFGDAFGQSLNTGDLQSMTEAMTAWVNGHGGLAGHPVTPIYYRRCVGCDIATEDQTICTTFGADHHAVAAIDNTETSTQLATCLASRGVAMFGGGVGVFEDHTLQSVRGLWSSYLMSVEATFGTLIPRLSARGWFPSGEKYGLIISDASPAFTHVAPLVRAQMKAIGKSFTDEAHVANLSTRDAASATLRFKADHITRIVILDSGSGVMLVFGPQSSSQGYYPKVSVTSLDVLGTAAGLQSARTYSGATGIGWKPADDGATNRPAPNAAENLCRSIYRTAGVSTSGSLAYSEAMALCDSFFFARVAYREAASTQLAALRTAIPALAASYLPPSAFSTRFGPGVYAGEDEVRDVQYDSGCRCFQYVSGLAEVRR